MGDEQRGAAAPRPELGQHFGEPALQLGAGDRVERAERLVEQQKRAVEQHGAQKGGALAHPAGEFARAPLGEAGQAEGLKLRQRPPPRFGARDALHLQPQRDIVEHGAPGEEQVFLGHVAEPGEALLGAERLAVDQDFAAVGRVEPGDQVEQGALAAAGGPDERDEFAVGDIERDIVERADLR